MSKRFHIRDDVWLVRTSKFMPEYSVEVAGRKVADFYFFREIHHKHGPCVTSRVTWVETEFRVEGFASYFKDALRWLRGVDWMKPAPSAMENVAWL
jgi:hypothetical protein